jgi:myosin heavy subunit
VIAKCLYESVYHWLVNKQKDLTNIKKGENYESIGILDISGFEVLNVNSLEQLCINYSNEKAQKLFTTSYFSEEKTLFESEGLAKYLSDFNPTNNEEVMRVIDNPKNNPSGVMQLLQSVSKSKRGDSSFLIEAASSLKNTPLFSKSKLKNDRFTIYHSSYPVEYNIKDFVEKCKDELPTNIFTLIDKSNPKMGAIISKTLQRAKDNKRMLDYLDEFKAGIQTLLNDLAVSRCNFIRCIKPNCEKKADKWDMPLVLNQLKFLGMKDFLTLKKKLYPLRIDYKEFCKKYLELNYKVNDLYFELEMKPSTNFKELAKQY